MKHILLALATTTLLFCAGCSSQSSNAGTMNTQPPQKVETVDTFGIVKSTDVTDIWFDFPAVVNEVNVKEGQKVKKGDVLMTINYDAYLNEINNKTIELKSLKQQISDTDIELNKLNKELSKLKTQLNDKSHPELKKLINDLVVSKKAYEDSQNQLKNKESLLLNGAISQADYDEYKKTVETNEKLVFDNQSGIEKITDSINSQISELELSIKQKSSNINSGILNEKIKACESEIKFMKDKINGANISGNNVISHMDNSIVYDFGYVKGEALNSSKKVASLLNLDKLIIESEVPEEFIKDVNLGSQVTIIPQADKSRTYKGKVTYIADKAVQQNGQTTVLLQSSIDNNDGFLMPDFNVTLEIEIAK
jgi:HlyD family secretion protein